MSVPENLVDAGSYVAHEDGMVTRDPLGFPGYRDAVASERTTGEDESVTAGRARVAGHDVEIACFNFDFFGGSMGEVAGERLARALERAARRNVPMIIRTSTGGARMQEGMRALVQMPKLVAARSGLFDAHQPLITLLGHPTTGGVLASIAALSDVTIAESDSTIGFAGPRLVERFTGNPLQEDSHTAFSALGNGLVDAIVPSNNPKPLIELILTLLAPNDPEPVERPPAAPSDGAPDAWAAVQLARDENRPHAPDLVPEISDLVFYLRGDRAGGEDLSVTAALARVAGRKVILLALDRAISPGPRAYRKACRAIDLAARLDIPVVTLIDTPGADPSEASEAGGIAWSIAELFRKTLHAPVPLLAIVTGEGGSGGALAFATGDRLLAYANSIFSVIGPEAASEILWRDPERAPEAARLLKITARDLHELGIADEVVAEPLDAESLRQVVAYHLDDLATTVPPNSRDLVAFRRRRWRTGAEQ